MKKTKYLPIVAVLLSIPGVLLRMWHLTAGFDPADGLPVSGAAMPVLIGYLALCMVLLLVLAQPLRARQEDTFEQLLGTKNTLFRMVGVMVGFALMAGGAAYLYLCLTNVQEGAALWANALEYVYGVVTIVAGAAFLPLVRAQGATQIDRRGAMCLLPLLWWGCLHLLVSYRLTCVDPKVPSFAFGLVADILLAFALYHLARLLFGAPRPASLGLFGAAAFVFAVTDGGGYLVSLALGAEAVQWPIKTLLRSGLSILVCLFVLAELVLLTRENKEK